MFALLVCPLDESRPSAQGKASVPRPYTDAARGALEPKYGADYCLFDIVFAARLAF